MNCSGKHAAMLATCVAQRLGHRDLPRPRPPAAAGDRRRRSPSSPASRSTAVAVDGCGAPLLSDLADRAGPGVPRSLGRRRDRRTRSGRVADAIRAPPGVRLAARRATSSPCSPAIPGAIGKAGAESCYAVALPDGRAFALKTDDGAPRVRPVLMAAALRRSGVDSRSRRRRRGGAPDGRAAAARRRRAGRARSAPASEPASSRMLRSPESGLLGDVTGSHALEFAFC